MATVTDNAENVGISPSHYRKGIRMSFRITCFVPKKYRLSRNMLVVVNDKRNTHLKSRYTYVKKGSGSDGGILDPKSMANET